MSAPARPERRARRQHARRCHRRCAARGITWRRRGALARSCVSATHPAPRGQGETASRLAPRSAAPRPGLPALPPPARPGPGSRRREGRPPEPELPRGPQHGAQVADVHLHDADLRGGAGGQQRGAGGLGAARVPAGQAQAQPGVLLQQPLAQRSADAAAGEADTGSLTGRGPTGPPPRPGAQAGGEEGRPGTRRAGRSGPDPPPPPARPHLLAPVTSTTFPIAARGRSAAEQEARGSPRRDTNPRQPRPRSAIQSEPGVLERTLRRPIRARNAARPRPRPALQSGPGTQRLLVG